MAYVEFDGIRFRYRELGDGLPFVFQHGLGGNVHQPFDMFPPPAGCRMWAFDCRAHGLTEPLGPADKIGIASFADDLAALLDHLQIERAVVGGISMGAAVTLNFALRYPGRITGLVQVRPAWEAGPNAHNAEVFALIAQHLRDFGAAEGKRRFQQTDVYQRLLVDSSGGASSICDQFDSPKAVERAVRFERMQADSPVNDIAQLEKIAVPALVLASRQDPIHDIAIGETIAHHIPRAEFHEVVPKSRDAVQYTAEVRQHLGDFLHRHFL